MSSRKILVRKQDGSSDTSGGAQQQVACQRLQLRALAADLLVKHTREDLLASFRFETLFQVCKLASRLLLTYGRHSPPST